VPKTRGVFALIMNQETKSVLISKRRDGKGWNLPGGRAEEGESDFDTLIREVREETMLTIEPIERIGEPLVFNEDTAVAYSCKVEGSGLPQETDEATQHRFCTAEELKRGSYAVPHKELEDGVGMTTGDDSFSLKLVGPEGRLGRTGRMIFDGLSTLEEPQVEPRNVDPTVDRDDKGVFVSDDRCSLIQESGSERRIWPRLDPYSPTGKMEPASS